MLRHWRRYIGLPVLVIVLAATIIFSAILAVAFFYQRTPAEMIRLIPDAPRKAVRWAALFTADLPYTWYRFQNPHVTVYDIAVDPLAFQELLSHVPTVGVVVLPIEAQKSISGKITVEGQAYDMKMDLRGDTDPHWLYPKKSWQVKVTDGKTIDGMEKLNFIVPQRRYYVAEMLNDYRAVKFHLPVPKHDFAILRINGQSSGVYYLTEGMTESFLAREGFVTPTDAFAERSINEPIFSNLKYWKKVTANTDQGVDDWGPLSDLLAIVANPDDAVFRQRFFELVDRDRFYGWYVHAWLSGSTHQDWAHNVRIVVDRQSGKLVFLPWDVGVWSVEGVTPDRHYSPMISRIIEDPELRLERDRRAYAYLADPKNIADDLTAYDRFAAAARLAFYQDRAKAFTNRFFDEEVQRFRDMLEGNASYLWTYLGRSTFGAEVFVTSNAAGQAVIDVLSGNPVPLDITEIAVNGGGTVVWDANGNGIRDASDTPLSGAVRVTTAFVPVDSRPELYMPMQPVVARTRFFIEGHSGAWQEDDIRITAKNILTGGPTTQSTRWLLETVPPLLP